MTRTTARRTALLLALLALAAGGLVSGDRGLLGAAPANADDALILPLEEYPIDDACGAWGWLTPQATTISATITSSTRKSAGPLRSGRAAVTPRTPARGRRRKPGSRRCWCGS